MLGPRHKFPLGSPAFPLFLFYETTTDLDYLYISILLYSDFSAFILHPWERICVKPRVAILYSDLLCMAWIAMCSVSCWPENTTRTTLGRHTSHSRPITDNNCLLIPLCISAVLTSVSGANAIWYRYATQHMLQCSNASSSFFFIRQRQQICMQYVEQNQYKNKATH